MNEENYIQNSADNITQIKSDGNVVIGNKIPTQITDNGNKVSIGIGGTGLQNIEVYKEEQGSKPYINIDAELDNLKKISKALSDNHINIQMISQGSSEVSIMIVINSEQEKAAIKALYKAFFE